MATKQIDDFPLATSADGNDILHLKTSLGIDKQLPIADFIASSEAIIEKETVLDAQNDPYLKEGMTILIKERANSLWEVLAATANNGWNIIEGTASGTSLKLCDESTLNIEAWGGKGDWDSTAKTGTDNQPIIYAAANYIGSKGGQIDFPARDGGLYKLGSTLTIHEGVVLNGLGTVGSVSQKGVKFICDHDGDGVIFDGNNSLSSTEGVEQQLKNIWILKAPDRNGGDGLSFVATDSSNTPGFIACTNVHVVGNPVSSGEGLWARGWVFDGTQATIGLKNGSFNNCGATGVSTDNGYMVATNLSEVTFDDFYVRGADASFPSGGAVGITLDSTQLGTDPAAANPSTAIKFSNSRILGDIIVGEVAKLYFSNSFAVNLIPSGVAGNGTNISWFGGDLVNKYVDAAGYATRVHCLNQTTDSDLSNQYRVTENLVLGKAHSDIFVTNPDAPSDLDYTLPQVKSTDVFDFYIKNNSSFDVNIIKQSDNYFFPVGTNLNSNISAIVIPAGTTARFQTNGNSGDSSINVSVLSGEITLTGLGSMSDRGIVSRIQVLTGNLLNRPREATHFILDGGTSTRLLSMNISTYNIGDEITIVNSGTTNNIGFDELSNATYSAIIAPLTARSFVFDGVIFSALN